MSLERKGENPAVEMSAYIYDSKYINEAIKKISALGQETRTDSHFAIVDAVHTVQFENESKNYGFSGICVVSWDPEQAAVLETPYVLHGNNQEKTWKPLKSLTPEEFPNIMNYSEENLKQFIESSKNTLVIPDSTHSKLSAAFTSELLCKELNHVLLTTPPQKMLFWTDSKEKAARKNLQLVLDHLKKFVSEQKENKELKGALSSKDLDFNNSIESSVMIYEAIKNLPGNSKFAKNLREMISRTFSPSTLNKIEKMWLDRKDDEARLESLHEKLNELLEGPVHKKYLSGSDPQELEAREKLKEIAGKIKIYMGLNNLDTKKESPLQANIKALVRIYKATDNLPVNNNFAKLLRGTLEKIYSPELLNQCAEAAKKASMDKKL